MIISFQDHEASCPDRLMSEKFLMRTHFNAEDTELEVTPSVTTAASSAKNEDDWDDLVSPYNEQSERS